MAFTTTRLKAQMKRRGFSRVAVGKAISTRFPSKRAVRIVVRRTKNQRPNDAFVALFASLAAMGVQGGIESRGDGRDDTATASSFTLILGLK